jgi:hypothetical protein
VATPVRQDFSPKGDERLTVPWPPGVETGVVWDYTVRPLNRLVQRFQSCARAAMVVNIERLTERAACQDVRSVENKSALVLFFDNASSKFFIACAGGMFMRWRRMVRAAASSFSDMSFSSLRVPEEAMFSAG